MEPTPAAEAARVSLFGAGMLGRMGPKLAPESRVALLKRQKRQEERFINILKTSLLEMLQENSRSIVKDME
ncbi:hypothetical protein NXZ84_04770 [Mechercharimyces sp. CAU 1602]|nr:hypothetical protein [Mechercharimyces sp. CAU 1602]